jgi:two-component system sensor histidine kinase MprB
MPLRARVSLLVMLTVGLTVALGAIVSYTAVRDEIVSRLDDDLYQRASLAALSNLADPRWLRNDFDNQDPNLTLTVAGFKASIVSADGTVTRPPEMISTLQGQGAPIDNSAPVGQGEIDVAAGRLDHYTETVKTGSGTYRVVAVPIPRSAGNPNADSALVLAASMDSTQSTLNRLGLISTLVGLAGIAVAGTAGFLIGRAALRPVQRLTVATEYIAHTGDLRLIEVTGDDELARLTTSFNTMLQALARSQEYQRRLVADAGHELRTPLTSMRTNLDLLAQAMAQPDNPRLSAQDRLDLMSDVRAQMEELSVLISDLVELSRDEHPAHAIEQVDFAEVVERAVERVQRRAPTLRHDLHLESWYLQGHPAALERAVTNLLDNAAKWSPPEGTVTVSLRGGVLQVADQGPGIGDEDLGHVFERFYRAQEARTMPGSGLGLAIVRQVAENHGGRVAAARAPGGGALLGVWLPGMPSADGAVVPIVAQPAPVGDPIASPQEADETEVTIKA